MSKLPFFCDESMLPPPGAHVVLGMSGGVDSSTTCAILQSNGCTVHGAFLKLFDAKSVEQAEKDAKGVGEHLGVHVETIDYRQQFSDFVIKPFVEAYCNGETPLPCALCNYHIKFDAFCGYAKSIGAEFVATGHYAQKKHVNGVPALCPAEDKGRDQSYFMFGISSQQLEMAVFPLGRAVKSDVRAHAKERGIFVSQKPDSQDICFLSEFNGCYATFIRQFLKDNPMPHEGVEPGPILDHHGNKIGEHEGAIHYTVGQRRGLGISAEQPLYVFKIERNNVYVGPLAQLAVKRVFLTGCNYHQLAATELGLDNKSDCHARVLTQYRSAMPPIPAMFQLNHGQEEAVVTFDTPQNGVSPGQAEVFRCADGTVLGGGWIARTE
jgi:tRNA-specific 2-thiouridylase